MNSTPDMIKDHFLPIGKKLVSDAGHVEQYEKKLLMGKHQTPEDDDFEADVQSVSSLYKVIKLGRHKLFTFSTGTFEQRDFRIV